LFNVVAPPESGRVGWGNKIPRWTDNKHIGGNFYGRIVIKLLLFFQIYLKWEKKKIVGRITITDLT
jgi:hypothetical protein